MNAPHFLLLDTYSVWERHFVDVLACWSTWWWALRIFHGFFQELLTKTSSADFAQRGYKDLIVGGCNRKVNNTVRSSASLPIVWTMTSPSPTPPTCCLGRYENERTSQFSVFTTFQTNHQICLISFFWLICFSSNIQAQRLVPDVSLFFHFLPSVPLQGSQKVWTLWLNSVVLCGLGQPPSDSSNRVSQTEKLN